MVNSKQIWLRQVTVWLYLILYFMLALLPGGTAVVAQESGVSRIFITNSSAASAPTIELHAYGMDGQGNVVDLSGQPIVIQHGDQVMNDIEFGGIHEGGTFTLFVLDMTSGVGDQIAVVQQVIQQYTAAPRMIEQRDYVAMYEVDEVAAIVLLEPATFYNSVHNLFAVPLQPHTGPTALYDSVVGLLNNLEQLKPNPALAPAIVIISDGTDAVSTQFQDSDVPTRAAELGVPIHTIWLDNERLQPAAKNAGRDYLSQVAAGTGGVAAQLALPEQVDAIWNRIASFHQQTIIRYTAVDLTGGEYPVTLSLRDNPAIQAQTSVTIPPGAPSITIDLPPESRQLTLENLDQPVELSFSTSLSWLDGVERGLTRAQLLVNGLVVQDIDVQSISRFNARINNFVFGQNRVQVAVIDEQGSRATSPEIILTIDQGATILPEEVQPAGTFDRLRGQSSRVWSLVGGCFLILLLLVATVLVGLAVQRWGILRRLGLPSLLRNIPFLRPYMSQAAQVQQVGQRASHLKGQAARYSPEVRGQGKGAVATARPSAFLEVLEAVTRLPSPRIELNAVELRLGRSPAQADIAFENDITVSRIHASIVQEGEDYRMFDEQSTSGAWVNEQRVPEYGLQLIDGDEIRLGAVRLRFRQP